MEIDTSTNLDDLNSTLSNNYLLLDITFKKWSASRPDKTLAKEITTLHGASPEAVNVTRKLMAGADDELKALEKTMGAIRSYAYSVSLPWSTAGEGASKKGPRLIPALSAMEVLTKLKELQDEFHTAKQDFINVYAQRVADAVKNQGTLVQAPVAPATVGAGLGYLAVPANSAVDVSKAYPPVGDLDTMFTVRADISVVPTVADFSRVALPAQLATALGARMGARQEKAMANAMEDLTMRTAAVAARMATQLSKHASGEKTKLYASLVTNVRDLAALLETTNFRSDAKITELADMCRELCVYDIAQLKHSVTASKDISDKADALHKRAMTIGASYGVSTQAPSHDDTNSTPAFAPTPAVSEPEPAQEQDFDSMLEEF